MHPAPSAFRMLNGWRWLELVALAGTIPAFYLSVLSLHRPWSVALYGLAFAACSKQVWDAWHGRPDRMTGARLAGPLAALLLLSATLPDGDRPALLVVRLITAALIILRALQSLWPGFWRGTFVHLLALAVFVHGLCGLGFWWLEPGAKTFGDGLWLAFTTAATVGYGDIVPTTTASKIFSVFVVLMGFAALSMVTAAIAAMWVQSEEERIEREILRDLHRELKAVRRELADLRRDIGQGGSTQG